MHLAKWNLGEVSLCVGRFGACPFVDAGETARDVCPFVDAVEAAREEDKETQMILMFSEFWIWEF